MEYTTDTAAVVQKFLASKYIDAKQEAANNVLESKKVEFAKAVRFVGGKSEDVELNKLGESADLRKEEADSVADDIASKMDEQPNPSEFDAVRVEWLKSFIAGIEAEHAQHGMLLELHSDNPDQVDASTIAQIVIEGAHEAALEELNSLL